MRLQLHPYSAEWQARVVSQSASARGGLRVVQPPGPASYARTVQVTAEDGPTSYASAVVDRYRNDDTHQYANRDANPDGHTKHCAYLYRNGDIHRYPNDGTDQSPDRYCSSWSRA